MPNGRCWSLVFPASTGCLGASITTASGAMDDPSAAVSQAVVIEIFRSGGATGICWSVLISIADSLEWPTMLRCVYGVSNMSAECNRLATFGLPVVEGDIDLVKGVLTVDTAVFPERQGDVPSTLTCARLLTVSGIGWHAAIKTGKPAKPAFDPRYRTRLSAPDLTCPDSQMTGRRLEVSPQRTGVRLLNQPATVTCEPALYPDLRTVLRDTLVAYRGWAGSFGEWTPLKTSDRTRFPRRSVFGPPSFLFDEIEIVGFRTELKSTDGLIDRLNFHQPHQDGVHHPRKDNNNPTDFRYAAASSTVIIEMLRYGKMRSQDVAPPLDDDDFMSQHELLVRLVVGRVDDDTSQARDAALFVPSIFVDNAWSKAVGRQLQGFPKVLAEFRGLPDLKASAVPVPLSMDGRQRDNPVNKIPFHRVTEVHIATGSGDSTGSANRILSFDYPEPDLEDGSAGAFAGPELTSVFSRLTRRRSPWEQFDFDEREFRRAFARSIVGTQFGDFRVVQVSPVNDIDLPKAWILGSCALSNVRVAFPTGIATLRFERPHSAPQEWKDLCALLTDRADPIAFTTGDWYRVKCSMAMAFDDGLAW
jgi:hypothetical protein